MFYKAGCVHAASSSSFFSIGPVVSLSLVRSHLMTLYRALLDVKQRLSKALYYPRGYVGIQGGGRRELVATTFAFEDVRHFT